MLRGNTVGRRSKRAEEMARFLHTGTNVVTFAVVEISIRPRAPLSSVRSSKLRRAEGGTSLYTSGSEPGAMSMNVPRRAPGHVRRGDGLPGATVRGRSRQRLPARGGARASRWASGSPTASRLPRIADGTVETRWTPEIVFVADLLGVGLDDVRLEWETACTPRDIDTASRGPVRSGNVPRSTGSCSAWSATGGWWRSSTSHRSPPTPGPVTLATLPRRHQRGDRPHRGGSPVVPCAAAVGHRCPASGCTPASR